MKNIQVRNRQQIKERLRTLNIYSSCKEFLFFFNLGIYLYSFFIHKGEVPNWVQLGVVQFASFAYEGLVTMPWGCHRGMRKIGPAEPSLNVKTILVNNDLVRYSLISSISVHRTNELLVKKNILKDLNTVASDMEWNGSTTFGAQWSHALIH